MLCFVFPLESYMNKKIFIGVAWPYANGSLHLGHIAGCYLPADIFARYQRMKQNDVLMVSGSDEHGTPITITAENEKSSPKIVVDRFHAEHAKNMKQFGISFDLFTRTTTENHTRVVQDIFSTLYKNKHIYPKTIDALYCEKCTRFLPDRYIEGTCPHCGCEGARGDQCDHCGKLLDTLELKNVRCKICGGTPHIKTTEHLFFALSTYEQPLLKWITEKEEWKSNVQKFTKNWLQGGLKDRAITRDISWGIPVPVHGFENKCIYVWFDAVIGYLSASIQWALEQNQQDIWKQWWEDPKAEHYYFLAKDNIPFHSIIWPSILMSYNTDLQLPTNIPANEYLCLSGEQFSKSRCVAVWVPDILKQFDADPIRYYLSINMPENKDTNWQWADFVAKNNDELVGTYGNFIHRVLTFTVKNFGEIPIPHLLEPQDENIIQMIAQTVEKAGDNLDHFHFKKALREIMNLAQQGNVYFDHEQPWALLKTDTQRCQTVLFICLRMVHAFALLMAPFLPFSSNKLWHYIGNNNSVHECFWEDAVLPPKQGTPLQKPDPLFKKLTLEECIPQADPFSKLDLRVAKVLEVNDHPEADKLYLLQIDLGPLGKRMIVAGMKTYYSKEEILGKHIVVVINLKPAKIRGIVSNGMLLAATDANGTVSLLDASHDKPGAEISIDGIPSEPAKLVEFNEFIQISFTINDKQQAVYERKPLKTKKNIIVTDKPVQAGAKIK